MVYTAHWQPPIYPDMSLALFTYGYVSLAAVKSVVIKEYMYNHLQELMENIEVYGWKVVKDYHAVWLQLLEQGGAAWSDTAKKRKLRHLMEWCKPACKPALGAKQPMRPKPISNPPLNPRATRAALGISSSPPNLVTRHT